MKIKRALAALFVVGSASVVGCTVTTGTGGAGTSSTSTGTTVTGSTTSTTTTGSTTATATTGTGMAMCPAPTGDTATDCTTFCKLIWDCGEMATCNAGMTQLCPGFAPMGSLNNTAWTASCAGACGTLNATQQATLFASAALGSCPTTITQASTASPTLGTVCQTGTAAG